MIVYNPQELVLRKTNKAAVTPGTSTRSCQCGTECQASDTNTLTLLRSAITPRPRLTITATGEGLHIQELHPRYSSGSFSYLLHAASCNFQLTSNIQLFEPLKSTEWSSLLYLSSSQKFQTTASSPFSGMVWNSVYHSTCIYSLSQTQILVSQL